MTRHLLIAVALALASLGCATGGTPAERLSNAEVTYSTVVLGASILRPHIDDETWAEFNRLRAAADVLFRQWHEAVDSGRDFDNADLLLVIAEINAIVQGAEAATPAPPSPDEGAEGLG